MAHLVFQTAFPGDLFLSIPLLKRIRNWDPSAELALACRSGMGGFFESSGLVDRVIEIDKRSPEGRKRARLGIQNERWQTVFVPHESPRTQLWMTRVKAERKVAFANRWNFWIYDSRIKKPAYLPDALRQLSLLAAVDATLAEKFASVDTQALASPTSMESPLFLDRPAVPDWASMAVRANRPEGRKIFLAPGSVWATKRWTASGYENLAVELRSRGFEVVFVGSSAERELCETIARKVHGVQNLAGRTSLNDLVSLLSTGLALICNDSGAMHAAAAADLPTIAIFGPTTLQLGFRPWQNRAVVVQAELECRPCGKHGAQACPIGTHACMTRVTVSEVLRAFDQLAEKFQII